jgi:hypothetical protein
MKRKFFGESILKFQLTLIAARARSLNEVDLPVASIYTIWTDFDGEYAGGGW